MNTAAARQLSPIAAFCSFFSVLSLGPSGCGEGGGPDAPAPENPARADWPDRIVVGLIPSENPAEIVDTFRPLTDHLAESLGVELVVRPANSYDGVIVAMSNDQVDFAYFGPFSFVQAEQIAGAETLLMELDTEGNPTYQSVIIARADSGMDSLEDVRGKSFTFTNPNSTSGFLVPSVGVYMQTGETAEEFFGDIAFAGTHGNAQDAVIRGEHDAAATNGFDLEVRDSKGHISRDDLVVLWRSDPIPGSTLAARGDLPASLKHAFVEAVLEFTDLGGTLRGRGGYIRSTSEDYDSVRVIDARHNEIKRRAGDPD